MHKQMFIDAVTSAESGVSPREMHRRNPETSVLDWIRAGAAMYDDGNVLHAWSPVKNDAGCCQESRYTLIRF